MIEGGGRKGDRERGRGDRVRERRGRVGRETESGRG